MITGATTFATNASARLSAALRRSRRSREQGPLFVAWSRQPRSVGVAQAVGADIHMVTVGKHGQRVLVPVRYAMQAAATVRVLIRRHPPIVIAMCPPLALGVIVLAYARLTGALLAIDAHTGAIFRHGRVRWSMRAFDRCGAVIIVASPHIADRLEMEGLRRPSALHDSLPDAPPPMPQSTVSDPSRATVVVPLGWSPDEPLEEIAAAAAAMPDVHFLLTGRPRGALSKVSLPPNARRTGLIDRADYDALVASADVVLAVTTRQFTMLRAGYEAVAAHTPLVVSDTPTLRDYFGNAAIYASSDRTSFEASIRTALDDRTGLASRVAALAERHRIEHRTAAQSLRARLRST